MNTRPEIPAYALAIALVAAVATLAGIGANVPDVLPGALLAVLGGAVGVSVPLLARNEPLSAPQTAEQPAPGGIPSPPPAPAPVTPVTPVTDVTGLTAVPTLAPAPPPAPPAAG